MKSLSSYFFPNSNLAYTVSLVLFREKQKSSFSKTPYFDPKHPGALLTLPTQICCEKKIAFGTTALRGMKSFPQPSKRVPVHHLHCFLPWWGGSANKLPMCHQEVTSEGWTQNCWPWKCVQRAGRLPRSGRWWQASFKLTRFTLPRKRQLWVFHTFTNLGYYTT